MGFSGFLVLVAIVCLFFLLHKSQYLTCHAEFDSLILFNLCVAGPENESSFYSPSDCSGCDVSLS